MSVDYGDWAINNNLLRSYSEITNNYTNVISSTEIQSLVPWNRKDRKQMLYPLDHKTPQKN